MPLTHRIPLCVCLLLFCASSLAQQLNFRRYGNEDGLPQTQVTAMFQDNAGYLWVGTLSGVARYNGREWTVYTKSHGLAKNDIKAINQDSEGNILFGTGGGLSAFDGNVFTQFPDSTILGRASIADILVDQKKRIWVATNQGLVRIEKGQERREFTVADGLPSLNCISVYERNDGTIWVTTDNGVVWYDGSSFKIQVAESGISLNNVNAIVEEDRNGRLFFATSKGLFYKDKDQIRQFRLPEGHQNADLSDATIDQLGNLWFSSNGAGVFKITPSLEINHITTSNGLAYDIVLCMLVDRENTIWFGTDDGLSKLSEGSFVAYNSDHGLVDNFVRTVFEDADGRIWFGTRNGVNYLDDNEFKVPFPASALLDPRVYGIGSNAQGHLLFTTPGGLTVWDGQNLQQFRAGSGLPIEAPKPVYRDKRNRIWIGGNGLSIWEDGRFRTFPEHPRIQKIKFLDIAEDQAGNLWFATRNAGLLRYNQASQDFDYFDQEFDVALWSLDVDTAGAIWIGTNGLGLFKYDGNGFTRITSSDGLSDDFIWQVQCARNGDIWVGHNKGLDRLRGQEIDHYNKTDGLADNEASATACLEDRDNNLWFGSGKGVTKYLSGLDRRTKSPPMVHIESLEVNGREMPLRDGLLLQRNQNNLTFNFSGLSFRNEDGVRFKYQLQGQDRDWSEETADTRTNYNNLGSGTYTFLVRARSEDHVWTGEGDSFTFSIEPAFYETIWFQFLAALVIGLLIFTYHRYRIRRVENQKALLEGLVRKRTEELKEKNEELRLLSLSDSLTKLKNRRYLSEIMPNELKALKRRYFDELHKDKPDLGKCNLGFLMVDMDHFKKINDTYGHEAGDKVLVQLSNIFMDVLRSSDVVVRWGGEEFLILLKEVQKGALGYMANRILERVRNCQFDIGMGKSISGTASIGYAYYQGSLDHKIVNWELIVKLADAALYNAKNEGRDRAYGLTYSDSLTDEEINRYLNGVIQEGIDVGVFKHLEEGKI